MTGARPDLVLIGGLAMCAAEWEPLAQRLTAAGHRVVSFDNLQVGRGPRVPEPTIAAQAEHGWRQVDAQLGAGASPAVFGLSMGGMIAATMAALQPRRVSRLLLAATSPNVPGKIAVSDEDYEAWVSIKTEADVMASVRAAFGATAEERRPELLRRYLEYRLSKLNGQSRRDFVAQLDAIRAFPGGERYAALARAAVPATVIAGEEDRLFPLAHSSWIAETLGCPLRVLAKTGHMLHLEDERTLFEIIVNELG